jgi:hypothetical protein
VPEIGGFPRSVGRAFSGCCAERHDRSEIAGLINVYVCARVPLHVCILIHIRAVLSRKNKYKCAYCLLYCVCVPVFVCRM